MKMRQIKDKPILVTGAGYLEKIGFGTQIAKDLYEAGASVHILGRTPERLQNTREWVGAKQGCNFTCHVCDVTDSDQVNAVFQEIENRDGLLYGLVNNAAINPSRNRILDTSYEDFKATLETNLCGPFHCMQAAIPQMLKREEGGNIVNITSIFSKVGAPNQTSYAPSKFGLMGLTYSIGLQYCREGIAANCVAPGYTKTDLTKPLLDRLTPEKYRALINSHAIRREINPQEVSDATLYLLKVTPAITATTIDVSGGFLQNPPR